MYRAYRIGREENFIGIIFGQCFCFCLQTLRLHVEGRRDRHQLQQQGLRAERAGDQAGRRRLHHRVRHECGV